jgi:Flp pilus assembly protein TadD
MKNRLRGSLLPLLLITAAAAIIYSNVLQCPFVFDDVKQIVEKPRIRDLTNYLSLKELLRPRVVVDLTFAINYYFSGLNVAGYHVSNIFIHLLNSYLVYYLSLAMLRKSSPPNELPNSSNQMISLVAALLFVTHPIQTQAVTYTVQRYASMAAMFYMASVFFYLKARIIHCRRKSQAKDTKYKGKESKETTRESGRLIVAALYILSVFSGVLAFLSKQNAASLPAAIVLVEYLFISRKWRNWKKRMPWFALAFVVWSISMGYVVGLFTSEGEGIGLFEDVSAIMRDTETRSRWGYLCTQLNVLVVYIRLLFVPIQQNLDYDYPFKGGFFDGHTPLAFLFLIGIVTVGIFNMKKRPVIAFGIFWFFITLSVESSIIPIKDALVEHRLYLPSLGFVFIVSYVLFTSLAKRRSWALGMSILIIMFFCTATYLRNRVWKNPPALWSDVVSKSPRNPRGHYNLGLALAERGSLKNAVIHYSRALEIKPNYAEAHNNLGAALAELGSPERAVRHYSKALEVKPDYAEAHNNMGAALAELGSPDKAVFHYSRALEIDPDQARAHNNLGIFLAHRGNFKEAIDHFSKALKIDPRLAQSHNNLGLALAEQGNFKEAIDHFSKALQIKPDYAEAHFNLGATMAKQGRVEKAIDHFSRAVEIDPEHAKAHYNLGVALARQERLREAADHFSKALEIKPDYAEARTSLERALRSFRKSPEEMNTSKP